MKYLKLFEAFPGNPIRPLPNTQVEDDLKDICIELEDLGFNIQINQYTGILFIYKKYNLHTHIPFNFSEVKEVVGRIKDYLGDKLESVNAEKLNRYQNITSSKDLYLIGNGMISTIRIEYNSGLYESISNFKDMIVEMEDRLVDLQMNGYHFHIDHFISAQEYFVRIVNFKNKFSIEMINPYIEHLVIFMDSNGYEYSFTNYKDYEFRHEENEFYVSALTLEFYEKRVDSFNFNESVEEEPIDDVVKDICIELEDMGYTINYSEEPAIIGYRDNGGITIHITKYVKVEGGIHGATQRNKSEEINIGEIRDTLERLKDYLGDKLVYINCYIDSTLSQHTINDVERDGWYNIEDFNTDNINGVLSVNIKADR